ncbi:carbon-nitrogen hydrolase family protein [Lichenicoccus sp.]|uniref:carbon-nitrogen hydrolase family protein n=1 Tax=Lichenicoccus sp. TaxID=2781899 RepID=UPI003D122B46
MRISVIQMSPTSDKDQNIAEASRLIRAAAEADRPDLVVLPEMWSCLGGTQAIKFQAAEDLPDPRTGSPGGPAYRAMQALARETGSTLHAGSIGERSGERISNTSLVFGPDGRELARYRKIHLFDVVTPSGEGYRESDTYRPGDAVITVQVGSVRAGLAICYDLRFGELFLRLRREGAELIILPAAFTAETGAAHWKTLLRARAIETQCWLAASATCGRHLDATGAPRMTYGHSMLIDPWGTVVAQAADGPGWATGTLVAARTASVRAGIPVLDHRRLA